MINVRLYTGRLVINLEKTEKNGDKSAVAMLKDTGQLGCVFQADEILIDLTEEHESLETQSTCTILKRHTASRTHSKT